MLFMVSVVLYNDVVEFVFWDRLYRFIDLFFYFFFMYYGVIIKVMIVRFGLCV